MRYSKKKTIILFPVLSSFLEYKNTRHNNSHIFKYILYVCVYYIEWRANARKPPLIIIADKYKNHLLYFVQKSVHAYAYLRVTIGDVGN